MKNARHNTPPFDFSEAVERYKSRDWDMEDFCVNETIGYFLKEKTVVEDTPLNRVLHCMMLRNHLKELNSKKKNRNTKK